MNRLEEEIWREQRRIEITAAHLPKFFESIERQLSLELEGQRRTAKVGEITMALRNGWSLPLLHDIPPHVNVHSVESEVMVPDRVFGYFLCRAMVRGWVCDYWLLYAPDTYGDLATVVCSPMPENQAELITELGSVYRLSDWRSFNPIEHLEQVFSALKVLGTIVKQNNPATTL